MERVYNTHIKQLQGSGESSRGQSKHVFKLRDDHMCGCTCRVAPNQRLWEIGHHKPEPNHTQQNLKWKKEDFSSINSLSTSIHPSFHYTSICHPSIFSSMTYPFFIHPSINYPTIRLSIHPSIRSYMTYTCSIHLSVHLLIYLLTDLSIVYPHPSSHLYSYKFILYPSHLKDATQ